MERKLYCAECGCEIPSYEDAIVVLDNYLQVKYFEDPKYTIFCDTSCLMKAISAEFIEQEDLDDCYFEITREENENDR
jgi:hypothetical protein